jgi:catechol 2,3-dioxygenase-like lactoylglutathione lyase family enzyme
MPRGRALAALDLYRTAPLAGAGGGAGQALCSLSMPRAPSPRWYARPVLFVADVDRSIAFYTERLGFAEHWRHQEEGTTLVAQVDRSECELILSSQEPEKTGRGRMFISLDLEVLEAVRSELEDRGVAVEDGRWGYRLMIVRDPDGNELYFPYDDAAG